MKLKKRKKRVVIFIVNGVDRGRGHQRGILMNKKRGEGKGVKGNFLGWGVRNRWQKMEME